VGRDENRLPSLGVATPTTDIWSTRGRQATKEGPVGRQKKSELIKNLVHGMSVSPDGKRGAYEARAYRLFLSDGNGAHATHIDTGMRFHLCRHGSQDGAWVPCRANYACHPHISRPLGSV